jgi:hypothetical protein
MDPLTCLLTVVGQVLPSAVSEEQLKVKAKRADAIQPLEPLLSYLNGSLATLEHVEGSEPSWELPSSSARVPEEDDSVSEHSFPETQETQEPGDPRQQDSPPPIATVRNQSDHTPGDVRSPSTSSPTPSRVASVSHMSYYSGVVVSSPAASSLVSHCHHNLCIVVSPLEGKLGKSVF